MKKRAMLFLSMALCLVIVLCASGLAACNDDKTNNKKDDSVFVHTDGTVIIGNDGDQLGLYGTNLGGWLVQEAYMCPTDVGYEFGQLEMMRTLANRFGADEMYSLLDVYQDNWVSEADFAAIRDLGLNAVRIPFTYLTCYDIFELNEQTGEYDLVPYGELTLRNDAFDRLDWALDMCKKYGLYAILDMHGAVGSQSGMQHSGDTSQVGGRLWLDDETGKACRDKTKELWVKIATRYASRKEIACYDLLNEPGVLQSNGSQLTNTTVWDYYDELYKAIRAVDPNHAICMESCWETFCLPDPATDSSEPYYWQNVIYQYHHYNWGGNNVSNKNFYKQKQGLEELLGHGVPVLIGEFNVWGDGSSERRMDSDQTDADAWDGVMQFYCNMGWHFTTWALKANSTNSSWGLYNMNADVDGAQVNYFTDSKERIREIWSLHNSRNYHLNEWMAQAIKNHIDDFNATGIPRDIQYDILK